MGVNYNTSIVTDGLVLCLDAANKRSYPGSGTTWFDLSGNANANMFGSVPFDNSFGGCWDFTSLSSDNNSGSSSLGFTFSNNSVISLTNSITIFAILYQTQNSGQPGLFGQNIYSPFVSGFRFGTTGSSLYYGIGPTWKEGNLGSGSFLNKWIMATIVYDRVGQLGSPFVYGYINSQDVGSSSLPEQTSMINATPGIIRSTCCKIVPCFLSLVYAYNRALTPQEIRQNFNATKSRYGI